MSNKDLAAFNAALKDVDTRVIPHYSVCYDETNVNWSHMHEYNLLFLKSQMNYLNDRLLSRGHLFLNEVYDALGFKRTPAGQVVGWLNNDDGIGYVDYTLIDNPTDQKPQIQINFNVDGVIYDKI